MADPHPGSYPLGVSMSDLQPFLDVRNSAILKSDEVFSPGNVYIFRFLVRSFFKELPKTGADQFLKRVSGFMSDDINKYWVLGVTMLKLDPAIGVTVHGDNAFVTTVDKQVMTDDATWVLDIVVKPQERYWAWTNPSIWIGKVSNALGVWGTFKPVLDIVGAVQLPLTISETMWDTITGWGDNPNKAHFKHVNAWWQQRQPIFYVAKCGEAELSDPKRNVNCPQVNNTPFSAVSWLSGKVGEDGLGFANGLSDFPDTLKPYSTKSSMVVPPGILPKDPVEPGIDPSSGKPPQKNNNLLVMGAFAAIGYVAYDKIFKEWL